MALCCYKKNMFFDYDQCKTHNIRFILPKPKSQLIYRPYFLESIVSKKQKYK